MAATGAGYLDFQVIARQVAERGEGCGQGHAHDVGGATAGRNHHRRFKAILSAPSAPPRRMPVRPLVDTPALDVAADSSPKKSFCGPLEIRRLRFSFFGQKHPTGGRVWRMRPLLPRLTMSQGTRSRPADVSHLQPRSRLCPDAGKRKAKSAIR
jgi:hypothetical protein